MHMSFPLIHSANPLLRPHSRVPASLRPSTMLTEEWVTLSSAPIVLVWHSITDLSHRPRSETACVCDSTFHQGSCPDQIGVPCVDTMPGQRTRCANRLWLFYLSVFPLSWPPVPLGPLVDKSVAQPDFFRSRKRKLQGCATTPCGSGSSVNNRTKGRVCIKVAKSSA